MTSAADGIRAALEAELGVHVEALRPVAGGDVNDAFRADTGDGPIFIKSRAGAAEGAFTQEAADLRWLGAAGGLAVPEVRLAYEAGPRFLALEWIERGSATPGSDEALGRGLATVHAAGTPAFGAGSPLRLGDLVLPNDPRPTFAEFYADCRLRPLTRLAVDGGAFGSAEAGLLERVAERMPELAGPHEPPARTHGDLWSGNVLVDTAGRPYLIDPVAHGGHREVDLATLRVFGGPSQRCFDAYHEIHPLADGHAERVALWQLQIILVHVVLFGGGYTSQAVNLARRYA